MSKESLVRLLQAAAADEQLGQRLQSASAYEELRILAREQGLDLGDLGEEEPKRTFDVATGLITEELSDEELELVAGGITMGSVVGEGCFRSTLERGRFETKGDGFDGGPARMLDDEELLE